MVFRKTIVFALIVLLAFPYPLFAQNVRELKKIESPHNDFSFYIPNQTWGALSSSENFYQHVTDDDAYVKRTQNMASIWYAYALGTEGLLLSDGVQKHHIPIATQSIHFSQNYLWIVPQHQVFPQMGFYILRLIDFQAHGFKNHLPLFFIPTHPDLGPVKKIVATHNDTRQEVKLLITTTSDHPISEMMFSDVRDLLMAQTLSLATFQLMLDPNFEELESLIASYQKDVESITEALIRDFKEAIGPNLDLIPEDIKNIQWEGISAEDLTEKFSLLENIPSLVNLKELYAGFFAQRQNQFFEDYSDLVSSVEITGFPVDQIEALDRKLKQLEDPTWFETVLEDKDSKKALYILMGITLATTFVVFVLPKLLKKPFSDIGAAYSGAHYRTLNTSWLRWVLKRFPRTRNFIEVSDSGLAKLLRKLGPMEHEMVGLRPTGQQFKRAFLQSTGDTLTVVLSELAIRPLYRTKLDRDVESAILLDQPFDDTHTLWIQKNFLERIVGNQILGTIMGASSLSLLEREYNRMMQNFVLDTHMEERITEYLSTEGKTSAFKFRETSQHQLGKTMLEDMDTLKKKIQNKIHLLSLKGTPTPTVAQLELQGVMDEMALKWMKDIEDHVNTNLKSKAKAFSIPQKAKPEILAFMSTRLNALSQKHIQDLARKPGFITKLVFGLMGTVERILRKFFGVKVAQRHGLFAKEVWRIWTAQNEPYFWNTIFIHIPTRGSFNFTMYAFKRATSILFTTPLYISTYLTAKRKFGLRGGMGEFGFGMGYGFATNIITQWLFVHVYEEHLMKTILDLEWAKYPEYVEAWKNGIDLKKEN